MANLTQLRILEGLNGFLLVDKPAGIAFSTVVKTVKRKFNLVKVGHGGSLDAAASGLFILLVNDANKYTAEVMGADRAYTGTIRLGIKTNTRDIQGEAVGGGDFSAVTEADVAEAFAGCRGDIFQTEPRFCSVRREGSAGYEIADTGEHGQFMAHVYRFQPTAFNPPSVGFEVFGTKGLLVRSLADDVGEALGCGAALESLRRVRVGKFKVEDAVSFERLLEIELKDFPSCVMPLGAALL